VQLYDRTDSPKICLSQPRRVFENNFLQLYVSISLLVFINLLNMTHIINLIYHYESIEIVSRNSLLLLFANQFIIFMMINRIIL
jgi:hypothetical protein